ncbi:hypothetical protein BaRGS_00012602 [Batillaria attramentaria]|uniref:Apple domain-containing protein n=1 Tax=Batillaria attramentaria TaxID=370345 RepID=A0ABD0L9Y4_9CAEN
MPGFALCPACAQADLYPAFLMYPNSGMTGNNDEMHIFTTGEECRALCLNLDDCRAYEYSQPALKACNLQTTTPLDDPAAFDRGTDEGWEFYQRMCA